MNTSTQKPTPIGSAVGGPFLTALTRQEREPLNDFLQGLSGPTLVH